MTVMVSVVGFVTINVSRDRSIFCPIAVALTWDEMSQSDHHPLSMNKPAGLEALPNLQSTKGFVHNC